MPGTNLEEKAISTSQADSSSYSSLETDSSSESDSASNADLLSGSETTSESNSDFDTESAASSEDNETAYSSEEETESILVQAALKKLEQGKEHKKSDENDTAIACFVTAVKEFLQLKNYAKAIECYDYILEIEPVNAEIWHAKGQTYRYLGDNAKAMECFDNAFACDGNFIKALICKSNILYSLKNYKEAEIYAGQVVKINPNEATLWANYGHTLFKLDRYEQALECYNKAQELNKGHNVNLDEQAVRERRAEVIDKLKKAGKYHPPKIAKAPAPRVSSPRFFTAAPPKKLREIDPYIANVLSMMDLPISALFNPLGSKSKR